MALAIAERTTDIYPPHITGDEQTFFSDLSPDETDIRSSSDLTEPIADRNELQKSPEETFDENVKALNEAARRRGIYVVSAALVGDSPQQLRDAIALLRSPNMWVSGQRSTQTELEQLAQLAETTHASLEAIEHPVDEQELNDSPYLAAQETDPETNPARRRAAISTHQKLNTSPKVETNTTRPQGLRMGQRVVRFFIG